MARPVEIRASYNQDAGYLTRISRAVEIDTRQAPAWRKEVITNLQNIIMLFMQAEKHRMKISK